MNGQQRSRGSGQRDYSKINMVRAVEKIDNYREYKQILFLRPFSNTYMGYLDDNFFGFTVPEGSGTKYWLMDAKQAIDHYLDKIPFHVPVLEYDTFMSRPEYRPYVNALKMVKDKQNGRTL